jgi:hypothetical protein
MDHRRLLDCLAAEVSRLRETAGRDLAADADMSGVDGQRPGPARRQRVPEGGRPATALPAVTTVG